MDPRNQAYIPRSQRPGHDQTFGDTGFSGYGSSASMPPPTAQRVDWYNQRSATNNGVAPLPANYPRQPSASNSFDNPQQDPKSPVTHESKPPPPENPRILSDRSFLEHTRREGPTPNTCIACNASFQTNSGLEGHAKSARHSAFLCACNTYFGRLSSLARHINSNTGSGYHCELCEDRTLPRVDKLYDHLRDGHKVSQKVLDRYRNKALGRGGNTSRPIKPAPVPVATQQVAHIGGFDSAWSPSGQVDAMAGRHAVNMAPLSPSVINPAHLTNFPNSFNF